MKKSLTKYLIWAFAPLALASCSEKEMEEMELASGEGRLTMKVAPIGAQSATSANGTKEVMKSLRIVMTDANDQIRANEYFSYTNKDAAEFSDQWTYTGGRGEYNVYLIANEESVADFSADGLDSRWQGNIKDAIDSFKLGQRGFGTFINTLSFNPEYTISDNTIALPMTASYKVNLDSKEENCELYLVNSACKFIINFANYRNEEVTVSEVKFSNAATRSYLMANIAEQFQTIKGIYWIEWMGEVASETTQGTNNQIPNEAWGWLTQYNLPSGTEHTEKLLKSGEVSWVVPAQELQEGEEPVAGKLTDLAPFYLPESKNLDEKGVDQNYYLEFTVTTHDAKPSVISKKLGNLKTMFRNTRVTFNIELYKGKEDIYVEFGEWTERPAYGTIKPI
ncbi:MAG: hypothetical protein J1D77_02695 [Muribaculaceae bacterium]|nr:hypothetical protein [Muribaculaceae bacterium]